MALTFMAVLSNLFSTPGFLTHGVFLHHNSENLKGISIIHQISSSFLHIPFYPPLYRPRSLQDSLQYIFCCCEEDWILCSGIPMNPAV